MTAGEKTFKGLSVPLYGESTIQQQNAATDILTLKGAGSQSGLFFNMINSAGASKFSVTKDGILRLAQLKPTTGVDIGDMFLYRTGTVYRLGIIVTGTTKKYMKFSLTVGA